MQPVLPWLVESVTLARLPHGAQALAHVARYLSVIRDGGIGDGGIGDGGIGVYFVIGDGSIVVGVILGILWTRLCSRACAFLTGETRKDV